MALYQNIVEAVGGTPLVKINRIDTGDATVLVKLESHNPLSSVTDRIAKAMIEAAEAEGKIGPDTVIIEPTSGNTGVGLAFVCAAKGYKLILTMPESMSVERRHLLKILGADLVLTPADKGMPGAISKAQELIDSTPNSFQPQQFDNPANPDVHYGTTGPEIWNDTDGGVDIFVAGVGTGGTVSGVGRYLKEQKSDVRICSVEPKGSPVISQGTPGKHKIQGIGAGFIPTNYQADHVDDVLLITEEDAAATAKELAAKEGILVGISAGGNVSAAIALARQPENAGKTIVTVGCDTGERYLSTWLFEDVRYQD